ncbi:MAG: hypothetical protein JWR84_1704 [Caulobacter sp.]|nr:hypothetical protein [Caulobacter sp.]
MKKGTIGTKGRLRRPLVIEALHQGMGKAVSDFESWSDGESLADWGVEPVLTTYCAQTLWRASQKANAKTAITLEQHFGALLEWSGRRKRPGRPSTRHKALLERQSRRADLVLWNADITPRAIIEIKRSSAAEGLRRDAERLMSFIEFAGSAYEGSVRYGLLGVVIQNSARARLETCVRKFDEKRFALQEVAEAAGLRFVCHGPREVRLRAQAERCRVSTVVFEFAQVRGG